jgi:hypothetical protein
MSDRRRVLVISREFPPSIGPHPIRVAKLAKYLPEFGWDPTIMSVPTDHFPDRDDQLAAETDGTPVVRVPRLLARLVPPAREGRTLEAPIPTTAPGSDAPARSAAPPTAGPKLRSRLAGALLLPDSSILWALPAARRAAAMADGFDAIFTTAPPFSTHLIGDRVARSHHLAWVAEYRDNWTVNIARRRLNGSAGGSSGAAWPRPEQ